MRAACEKGGSGVFDGFSADVFSLGVVLHALLVGQYPWSDTHQSDTVFERYSLTRYLPGITDAQVVVPLPHSGPPLPPSLPHTHTR